MNPEHPIQMQDKALATLARTDGIAADDAQWVQFEDSRWGGQYVIVRKDDEVVGVYKVVPRLGPAKVVPGGGGAVIVNSFSVGLKRIKRPPKGLLL